MFSVTTLRELFRLAFPIIVSQGAFALMIFTDRLFLSRIDPTHIAASLGGGVGYFVSLSLFTGVISYATALVAQYFGSGQLAKCSLVVTQGVLIALLCQPVLLLVAYFMADIFQAMGHDPRQVELERQYYLLLMTGSLFGLTKSCLAGYFSGIGRTQVIMVSDVAGVMVNIPLTYVLIFGEFGLPAMGIRGAALATVVSMGLTVGVYLLFYLHRGHRRQFKVMSSLRLHRGIMRRYIRLGLPSGFEQFIGAATFNVFLLLFQSYGVAEGAAMAIVFNWDMLSFVPLMGMNIAITSMIGRCVGSGDMTRANQLIAAGFLLALLYSGTLGLCFVIFRVELVEIFAPPTGNFAAIRNLGSTMMIGLATYVMADATILVASGTLRGAGDTRWLMNTSMLVHIVMLVCQVVVIKVLNYGPIVSWWTFVVMLLSLALIYLWRLLGNTWRQPARLARVMTE